MSASETPYLDAWNAKHATPEEMQRTGERMRERARAN